MDRGYHDLEFPNISDDPLVGLFDLELHLRSRLASQRNPNSWEPEREYLHSLKAYIDEYEIDCPFNIPLHLRDDEISEYFREVEDFLRYAGARLGVKRLRGQKSGIPVVLKLDTDFRKKIHDRLTQIRSFVEASDLSDRKKDSIYAKIASLRAEIDREKTRLEAFMALQLDIAESVGETAEKLKPAVDLLENLVKIFSRAPRDSGMLEAPADNPKLIAPPESGDRGSE